MTRCGCIRSLDQAFPPFLWPVGLLMPLPIGETSEFVEAIFVVGVDMSALIRLENALISFIELPLLLRCVSPAVLGEL